MQRYSKSAEELRFGIGEVKFQARPIVDFVLNGRQEFVGDGVEVGSFGKVLSYEFVGVLNSALLPRGISIGEVDCRPDRLAYAFMFPELHAVVSGDGEHMAFVREQGEPNLLCHFFRAVADNSPHDKVVGGSLTQGEYLAALSFPHDEVHFPVTEALPVHLMRAVVYAHPVGYICRFGRLADADMVTVAHLVTAVLPQVPAVGLVPADSLIDGLMGYGYPLVP